MSYVVLRSYNNAPWYEVASFGNLADAKAMLSWYGNDGAQYKIIDAKL